MFLSDCTVDIVGNILLLGTSPEEADLLEHHNKVTKQKPVKVQSFLPKSKLFIFFQITLKQRCMSHRLKQKKSG